MRRYTFGTGVHKKDHVTTLTISYFKTKFESNWDLIEDFKFSISLHS